MSAAPSTVFRLRQPAPQLRLALADRPVEQSFADKHRPRTLAEMAGNLDVLKRLRKFAARPYPRGFLFHGETGTGKSTAALALAYDLGARDMAGLHVIQSSCQDVDTVRETIRNLHYTPFPIPGSSGWHAVIVEEADLGSKAAKALWLSALENLPPRVVIIFTSNTANFEQRFLDRVDCFPFPSSVAEALDAAQVLADHLWLAETGSEDGPDVTTLPNVVIDGKVSFRRVVSALETLIRYGD